MPALINCGWVDCLEWSGSTEPEGFQNITYTYSPSGQRIEKSVDDVITKYSYDGGACIAEYDEDNNLLRKYIYGPGVDQPICMIDVEDSNSVYYYHFDGLGSVVALSDSGGDTVQTYEYSIFGQVAASDPNHPNPFMFTGRRLDFETGLYFYRARYYNPYIGRFMQTDPVGYSEGTNLYTYCGNNPLNRVDPSGAFSFSIIQLDGSGMRVSCTYTNRRGKEVTETQDCYSLEAVWGWIDHYSTLNIFDMEEWKVGNAAWWLSNSGEGGGEAFWDLYLLQVLDVFSEGDYMAMFNEGVKFAKMGDKSPGDFYPYAYKHETQTIYWSGFNHNFPTLENYRDTHYLSAIAHELDHAYRWNCTDWSGEGDPDQIEAIKRQNKASKALYNVLGVIVFPCMSVKGTVAGLGGGGTDPTACQNAWAEYTDAQVVPGPYRMGIPPARN